MYARHKSYGLLFMRNMSAVDHYADSSNASSSQLSYQDSFLQLFREITKLQWVRESLSSHSKHYEGLQQRHKKEQTAKIKLQSQLYVRWRLKRGF